MGIFRLKSVLFSHVSQREYAGTKQVLKFLNSGSKAARNVAADSKYLQHGFKANAKWRNDINNRLQDVQNQRNNLGFFKNILSFGRKGRALNRTQKALENELSHANDVYANLKKESGQYKKNLNRTYESAQRRVARGQQKSQQALEAKRARSKEVHNNIVSENPMTDAQLESSIRMKSGGGGSRQQKKVLATSQATLGNAQQMSDLGNKIKTDLGANATVNTTTGVKTFRTKSQIPGGYQPKTGVADPSIPGGYNYARSKTPGGMDSSIPGGYNYSKPKTPISNPPTTTIQNPPAVVKNPPTTIQNPPAVVKNPPTTIQNPPVKVETPKAEIPKAETPAGGGQGGNGNTPPNNTQTQQTGSTPEKEKGKGWGWGKTAAVGGTGALIGYGVGRMSSNN